jgi:hypothetical protein
MADNFAYEVTGNGLFGVIDLNTGVFTSFGSTGLTLAGLGSYGGIIYGAPDHGTMLYTVNTSTGALTAIGAGSIGGGYALLGSTTTGLYALGWDDALYSINPVTGAATELGLTNVAFGTVMGISTGSDTLYVTTNNSLYALSTTNGSATLIGNTTEGETGFGALVTVGGVLYGGAYGASTPDIYTLDAQSGAATFVAASPSTPSAPNVAGFWGLAPLASPLTMSAVTFNNATATFYQTYNGSWLPSQMIDGITTPGNGWAIYQNNDQGGDQTHSETALLTLASPVAAGPHVWTITLYQNNEGGHLLGDFSLGYSTDLTPNVSSTEIPFTVTGASSLNGTTFTSLGGGQLLAGGLLPETDVYTIILTENSPVPITGLFLNAINDPNNGLPTGGPGRMYLGNFVVTELTADVSATLGGPPPVETTITATTDNGPTFLSVGRVVTISLNLNEAVYVTGQPFLLLNDTGIATYTKGSGTNSLTFTYTVQPGDNTANLQVTGINLNGGTIQDGGGAALSGPVQGDLGLHIDTIAPATPAAPTDSAVVNGYVTVYTISLPPTGDLTLTGTITTDGKLGTLTLSDILDWDLTVYSASLSAGFEFLGPGHGSAVNSTLRLDSDGGRSPDGAVATATTLTLPSPIYVFDLETTNRGPGLPDGQAVVPGTGAEYFRVDAASGQYDEVEIGVPFPLQLAGAGVQLAVPRFVNAAHDTANQVLTGTAENGSTVTLYDYRTQIGTTTADTSTGVWSFLIGTLADASAHSYTVTATDAAGNVSQPSAALNILVDTTAPTVAITSTGGLTNHVSHLVSGTVNVPGTIVDAGTIVAVFEGTTQLGTAVVQLDGSWSTNVTLTGDGLHTLTATDTDLAGNTGTSNSIAFTLDTTGPQITITQTLAHDTGISQTDRITNDGHVSLSGTVSDANGVAGVEVFDGTTDLGPATITNGGWTFPTVLGEGTHSLHVVAADKAGNPTTSQTEPTIVVDNTAPVPFMSDATKNTNNSLSTLTGVSEANSKVSVYDGAKLIGTVTADGSGNWTLQTNINDSSVHNFTEKSTDLAGNTGASAGVTLYSLGTNKTLAGGTGNDYLIAGPKDTLTGGAGNDTFVFNANFGNDVVKDFDVNHDNLALSHTFFGSDPITQLLSEAHDSSAGAVIALDAHESITLNHVTVAQLTQHPSDFHFF